MVKGGIMKPGIQRILAGSLAVLLVSLACGINVDLTQPPPPTDIPPATQVAQTFAALTAANAPGAQVGATSTPAAAADTPTAVVFTSTPQPTTVTSDALCYAGPGDSYEVVSAIKQGTQVKLLGKGAASGWWVLANPIYTDPCWIMKQYVSIDPSVDTSALKEYAVPPTPTPMLSFTVSYDYLNICSGWDPAFQVTNTSSMAFRSYDVVVTDSNTSTYYERKANDFGKPSGCSLSSSISELGPNQTGWVHTFGFPYNLTGKKLDATITLCTEDGLGGACVTRSLQFKP
jgi:uncharacterized protein YraI